MIVTLHLIIAHLLADFVFQTNKILKEKEKSISGHIKHVSILAALVALFIFPFLNNIFAWLALSIMVFTHFFQDHTKIKLEKKYNKNKEKIWPFFLDQALHLSVIFILGYYMTNLTPIDLPPWFESLYFNINIVLGLTFLILISFTLDIVIYEYKRSGKKQLKYKRHFKNISFRFLAFLVFYLILLTLLSYRYNL